MGLSTLSVQVNITVTFLYVYIVCICIFFQRICENVSSIEALLLKSENEMKSHLPEYSLQDEELRRLTRASYNLKKYSGKYYYINNIFFLLNLCKK